MVIENYGMLAMIRNFDRSAGDIVTNGSDQFLRGKESTAAGIYHRLRMFFGEYFLDITDGTPWMQSILGKAPQDVAEAALKQRIITAPDVIAITAFSFDIDRLKRYITVDCTVIDINNAAVRFLFEGDIFETPSPITPDEPAQDTYIVNLNSYALVV